MFRVIGVWKQKHSIPRFLSWMHVSFLGGGASVWQNNFEALFRVKEISVWSSKIFLELQKDIFALKKIPKNSAINW